MSQRGLEGARERGQGTPFFCKKIAINNITICRPYRQGKDCIACG